MRTGMSKGDGLCAWFVLGVMLVAPELALASGVPTWAQEHYRWRNDDGSESAATWKANQDVAITEVARGQNIRLRFDIANTSTSYSGSAAPVIEFSTSTSGPWTQVSVTTNGLAAFAMTPSANFAHGDATTALLAGSGAFIAGKMVEYPNNAAPSVSFDVSQCSNFEYCFRATAKARGSMTYYFRLSGMTTYSAYPTLTMAAGEANEPPKIASALSAQASVVTNFTYTIDASGSEPIACNATSLPAGLSFDGVNKIAGFATTAGTYPVPISAVSAWGGDTQTLSIAVVDNVSPVALNQTLSSLAQGCEATVVLTWSDADQPALLAHTFSVVSGPSHGTLTSYYQRNGSTNYPSTFCYRADTNFIGSDAFTWKCNDGKSDSNLGTVTIPIVGNNPPVANNTTVSGISGQQLYCSLSCTHADTGQTLTFSIVSQPSHGTVSVSGNAAYYLSEPGYGGSDSFTWKCNDGAADSNVATVSITLNQSPPVELSQTALSKKDMPATIPAAFGGGGGYVCEPVFVSYPSHGEAVVTNGQSFYYHPASGYLGGDSFLWRMKYWNATSPVSYTASATCTVVMREETLSNDWPQWGYDEYRSGVTPHTLPESLYLQWRRDYPAYSPESFMKGSDLGYQPVVVGKVMAVNITGTDKVVALDTETGEEKWRFYTEGPTHMAPVAANGRVWIGSDDGCVYCLDAESGALVRKVSAGPSSRRIFANRRLASPWMVRGGMVLADGKIVFASGLWPMEGVFVCCLDAATGDVIWREDSLGAQISDQPHTAPPTISGPSPQGYLVVGYDRSKFYVPGTEAFPAVMNRLTGSVLWWTQCDRGGSGTGGYKNPLPDGSWALNMPALKIVAGSRQFTATEAAALGVGGTVRALVAADGKLFVTTAQGGIYCFGGTQATPRTYPLVTTPLPVVNDIWTTRVQQIIAGAAEKEGCLMAWGVGTGRLAEELVKQAPANARIVVVDPDTNKISALRLKMDAAGYYGVRIAALTGAPIDSGLPPYVARLIVSEDLSAAGYDAANFPNSLHYSLMPYGGAAWLPMANEAHSAFAARVSAANLELAQVDRAEPFSILRRTSLNGGSNLKEKQPAYDRTVTGPMGVLWFDNASQNVVAGSGNIFNGRVGNTGVLDAYTGLTLSGATWDGTSGIATAPSAAGKYVNPFTGESDPRGNIPRGYGCGATWHNAGYLYASRANTAAFYDTLTDAGTVNIAGIRSVCNGQSGMVGCGVLYEYAPGCSCAYSLRASMSLVPMPEVENWTRWGTGPTQNVLEERPTRRLGLNFGAPGQMKAPDGKLWKEFPPRTAPSPNVLVYCWPRDPGWRYRHSSRIENGDLKWVASSCIVGVTNLVVGLSQPVVMRHTAQAPAIDGSLGDGCWAGEPSAALVDTSYPKGQREFERLRYTVGLSTDGDPAFAWLRYDAGRLYIGVTCPPEVIYADGTIAPWGNGWADRWDVYLSARENVVPEPFYGDVLGVDRYLRMGVDHTGAQTTKLGDSHWSSFREEVVWAGSWQCAVSAVNSQPFTAEFSIPWSTIEAAGLWKDNLIINIIGPRIRRLRPLTDGTTMCGVPVAADDGACNRFSPLFFDEARGPSAAPVAATVRLYFAETEGALAGQRVFDVKLNGQTVESHFDIYQAAGGSNRTVVREYPMAIGTGGLRVDLVPKVGQTLIGGLEVEGVYGMRTNQPPAAVIVADVTNGPAPLTVNFNARQSSDDVGIAKCEWAFGDGDVATGSLVTHTFREQGSHVVRLQVTDSDGSVGYVMTTTTVAGGQPGSFICKIRSSGGDYTNLSTWEAAIQSDLTVSDSMVFGVSDRGTYAATDDGTAVTFTGGGTGVLKHVNLGNVAYIVGCGGLIEAGPVTCMSGHRFTIGDSGCQVRLAVAECYHDWPDGLADSMTMDGWVTGASNYVKVVAAVGHRHNGKLLDESGHFTGFAVRGSVKVGGYARLEGLIVADGGIELGWCSALRDTSRCEKTIVYRAGIRSVYGRQAIGNSVVIDSPGYGVWGYYGGGVLNNVTIVNAQSGGIQTGEMGFWAKNTLVTGTKNGRDFGLQCYATNCASGDASAGWNGSEGNRSNQTFRFVAAADKDFHLAADDTGARNWGRLLCSDPDLAVIDDMDGDSRTDGAYDIGADETPATGMDAYGIPDAWKMLYFGSPIAPGSGALEDYDHDGMNNYGEWRAGTNPTDAGSRLQVTGVRSQAGGAANFVLSWTSVAGRFYTIQRSTNLLNGFPVVVATDIPGTGGMNSWTTQVNQAAEHFRIRVE